MAASFSNPENETERLDIESIEAEFLDPGQLDSSHFEQMVHAAERLPWWRLSMLILWTVLMKRSTRIALTLSAAALLSGQLLLALR